MAAAGVTVVATMAEAITEVAMAVADLSITTMTTTTHTTATHPVATTATVEATTEAQTHGITAGKAWDARIASATFLPITAAIRASMTSAPNRSSPAATTPGIFESGSPRG